MIIMHASVRLRAIGDNVMDEARGLRKRRGRLRGGAHHQYYGLPISGHLKTLADDAAAQRVRQRQLYRRPRRSNNAPF